MLRHREPARVRSLGGGAGRSSRGFLEHLLASGVFPRFLIEGQVRGRHAQRRTLTTLQACAWSRHGWSQEKGNTLRNFSASRIVGRWTASGEGEGSVAQTRVLACASCQNPNEKKGKGRPASPGWSSRPRYPTVPRRILGVPTELNPSCLARVPLPLSLPFLRLSCNVGGKILRSSEPNHSHFQYSLHST